MTFAYIDRKKRLKARSIQIFLYICMAISLPFFWRWGRFSHYEDTIMEGLMNIDPSYRTAGSIVFGVCIILLGSLSLLIPYKGGQLRLSKERIQIQNDAINLSLPITEIDQLIFTKDLPYEGDSRTEAQKASRFQIRQGSRHYDWELQINTSSEFQCLIPIMQHWKTKITDFKEQFKA